jgi:hypothetical protein
MNWFFPSNNGGQESGFHDAGVETFRGNIDGYVARESLQNCVDARSDRTKPVHVIFQVREHSAESLPGRDELRETLQKCAQYWKSDKRAKAFFDNATEILKARALPILRIGDYNTTGVLGTDTDRTGNWYNLVKCAGSSSKGAGEGGSFGIGKNAPFAASQLRTVFYSTFNKDGERIFQGVARLVTHENAEGERVQATGLFGGESGASVRDVSLIPSGFGREVAGTDIFVLGYQASENWEMDMTQSVLENFWPAIHNGALTVEIAGTIIDKERLPELMDKFSAEKGFGAHFYYRACVLPESRTFTTTLKHLGDVSLQLLPGDFGLPKKIALTRQTGMVIQPKAFRSLIPFSGYFVCANDTGNARLRDMEPPRHDSWNKDLPERNSGKKALDELFDWMRDCIEKLRPSDDSKVISIPDLYKFLPDDDESEQPELDAQPEGTLAEETTDTTPSKLPIHTRAISRTPTVVETDSQQIDETGSEITETKGDEPTGGGGVGEGTGGDGGTGEGAPVGEGHGQTSEAGGTGGKKPKQPIVLRWRAFMSDAASGTYSLVVVPEVTKEGLLAIFAVGDDARREPISLNAAKTTDGEPLAIENLNRITGLALKKDEPLRLTISLKEPDKLALEVLAYEA